MLDIPGVHESGHGLDPSGWDHLSDLCLNMLFRRVDGVET